MHGITTIGATNLSNYNERMFSIEVAVNSPKLHHSHYTLKVSYNRLGRTVQRIQHQGGKIISITPLTIFDLNVPTDTQVQQSPSNLVSSEPKTETKVEEEQSQQLKQDASKQTSRGHRKQTDKTSKSHRKERKARNRR